MTFVDTGAWAALFVPVDPMHDTARTWLEGNNDRLVTSDYVVDEVVTLLKTRFSTQSAIAAGQALLGERLATFIYLLPDDIQRAWKIFRTHTDKGWSFTDCTSFALMQRLHISTAFAFDKHFSQMRGIRREPI
jgi:predicted nucleic acid-binding protein